VERLIRAYLAGRRDGEPIQEFFSRYGDQDLIAIASGEAVMSPVGP